MSGTLFPVGLALARKHKNFGNRTKVEILTLLNPNGPCISTQSVPGSVTHSSVEHKVWMVGYRPQALINSSTARMCASHTHGVACRCLCAAAL